jgi:hypothetical protein
MTKSKSSVPENTRGKPLSDEVLSKLLLSGDITGLSEYERVLYYKAVCERVGLDPSTQPFTILNLKKKKAGGGYEPRTILYLNAGGAQQLNKLYKVSHSLTDERLSKNLYRVFYRASLPDGRYTDSCGAVAIDGLEGEDLANAVMRAESKSKRRSTLDLLGLSFAGGGGEVSFDEPDPERPKTEAPPATGDTDGVSDVEGGDFVFEFSWNKGKTIAEVYKSRGRKEIEGAIAWAGGKNKFPDFITAARKFLESISGDPEPQPGNDAGNEKANGKGTETEVILEPDIFPAGIHRGRSLKETYDTYGKHELQSAIAWIRTNKPDDRFLKRADEFLKNEIDSLLPF